MSVYKQFKRLQDNKDAREFMQAVINAYDKDEIDTSQARCYGYLIKVFLDTVEASDIQERIEKLEELANKRGAA